MKSKQLRFRVVIPSTSVRLCSTIQTRFFSLVAFSIIALFLSNAYAQEYTRMGLPEGAKHRIGKGGINGGIAYSLGSSGIWMYDARVVHIRKRFCLLHFRPMEKFSQAVQVENGIGGEKMRDSVVGCGPESTLLP